MAVPRSGFLSLLLAVSFVLCGIGFSSALTREEKASLKELTEKYVAEVANYLPEYVLKDPEMIKSKLEWRKINFPNKVTLSAPDRHFDFNIQIINSKDELESIDPEDENVTIVKIIGKPYQKD